MFSKKIIFIILLFFLSSCVETVILTTATTGIMLSREKSIKNTGSDIISEAKIDYKFLINGLKSPLNKVGVTVNEQRVLLTGIVENDDIAKKASKIAWQIKDLKEVINEIQIKEDKNLWHNSINYFTDASITSQISSKVLFSNKTNWMNFKIITINKVVYLIGVAKNENEIRAITDIAATTFGVRKVISHIILDSDNRRFE